MEWHLWEEKLIWRWLYVGTSKNWLRLLAIGEAAVGLETNVLKSQVQEQYLNLVGLDGLPGAVSVERKNQRVKYRTHRVTGGKC